MSASLRVLLAEDDPVSALITSRLLQRLGCVVDHVTHGVAALEKALGDDHDLVLLDTHMPALGGHEVARCLRRAERASGRHIPLFAVSASGSGQDALACLAAGADGCFAKPLDADAVRDLVGKSTRLTGAVPPLDLDAALERCGGDPELLASVAGAFSGSWRASVAALSSSVAGGDAVALAHDAHRLKGTLASLCAYPGAEMARALESSAGRGELALAKELAASIERQLLRIEEALGSGGAV